MEKYQKFLSIQRLISEQEEVITGSTDFKKSPRLLALRKKAANLYVQAEYERSKNQLRRARLDSHKIDQEEKELKGSTEEKTRYPKPEGSEESEGTKFPRNPKDENLDSGNPLQKKDDASDEEEEETVEQESIFEAEEEPAGAQTDVSDEEIDYNNVESEEEEQPNIEIAGDSPQTEEEAKIAHIQAKTREIQANIGEYTPPGAPAAGEEEMPEEEMGEFDPMAMGGMGGEPQKPDPLKGFGDTTDPQNQMGMGMGYGMGGGFDPITGQPIDTGPAKTASAVGRLYMLKKLYRRFTLLDKVLTNSTDPELRDTREEVKEAFEIFKVIVNNLKTFKEKADELIIDFYMLIRDIATDLEAHYKRKRMETE